MSASLFRACAVTALLFGCALLAPRVDAAQPDYAREARLANQIVDMILDGDAVWLEANQREFLGIYTEANDTDTGVLVLHGRGYHPDWADVVNPVRIGLVERGYSTLSLQMPVLAKDAKYYDYVPIFRFAHARIDAGIEFLRDRGYRRVVLLAHSCGVHMAMDWVRERGDDDIDAFIGLGMGATDYGQPMQQPFPLETMRVAVLDIYGAEEFPAVKRGAAQRKAMMESAGHPKSRQRVLASADHYFTDQGEVLASAVADWLANLE